MATTNEQMNNLLSPDDMMLEDMEEGTFDQAKKDTAEFAKSVARGSITSPITAAADVVDTGKMLPTLDEQVKPLFPMYSSIEGAFEELSNLGISRENAVDLIRKATNNKIDLKGDTGEFVGEFISPAAATKAAGAIATSAAKYGSKAVDSVSRIAGEAKKLFSDAGGFDDLAMATAGSPSAQTAKMLDSPELPDTSVTKIIIGSSGKDYEKKSKAYESAKKELSPFGSNNAPVSDSEAQELWNRTGAQEDLVDNDIVYEIPTVNAKLKIDNPDAFAIGGEGNKGMTGTVSFEPKEKITLSNILDFDELFEQAPYLKDIEVKKVSGIQRLFGTKAGYNPVDNTIYIADGTPKELTSDLLHEVEHAVQNADGKRFDGGNFNRIMKEDPEYKKLGGDAGINKLNQLKRDILDDYATMLPGNLEAGTRRETVRNFLDTYGTLPDPDKFIKEVKKLSTNKDSKHGGGTFSYLSDIREWMDENFPDVEYEYESKIGDTIKYIKTASARDLKNIIKDYNKNNLQGLETYKKIKERAVLKYMRDPGEVTARNVQFRFKLSQADPSITRVAPRFTEDKAAKPLQIPDVREGEIYQPRRESEMYTDPEVLRDKARELGVELSDDNVLPIAEGQRYYLASKAEQGGDTAQSLAEQTDNMISVFPKPERMFPEGERPKGGDYLNPQTGEVLSGRNVSSANIKINPDGKPAFKVSDDNVDEVGSVGKGKSNIKVNLFKKKAGWKWDSAPDEYKDIGTLVSVEHKGKHFYTLETDFSKGVTLKKYPDSKTEPRLRPTVVGNIEIGEEVGSISVRGKKHPVYGKITTYNKGGAVPMNTMSRQMELFEPVERGFEEGGLMDEGGTIDPVSGNDVPPGSTQEEVRDDIPAQLSEGEFVFPADVVRYIGLEKLMRMRQEAKMGLAAMEAMGQMGNSEEAIMPDDLPFDMYDLEVEDDTLEMQTGGVVPSTSQLYNIPSVAPMYGASNTYSLTGQPASTMPTPIQPITTPVAPTGMASSPVTAASAAPYTTGQVGPNLRGTSFTPTAISPVAPTFQETIGAGVVGVDYEFVEFTNEAGQTIRLRRNKTTGEMIDPIPEGFYERVREEEQVETTPTTDVGTRTTRVVDDGGGRDDDGGYQGATVALGGTSGTGKQEGLRVDSTVVGVSYNMPNVGLGALPGIPGGLAKAGQFAISGLPETSKNISPGQPGYNPGGTASFFSTDNPRASITVTAEDFNNMKADGFKGALAESYRSAVNAVSAIRAGDINAYNNLSTDRLGPSGKSAKDLVDAATIQGFLDNVDIDNPQGFFDNLSNAFTGSFADAVSKLNDAEKAVLDGMGVDLEGDTFGKGADELDDTIGYGSGRPSAVFDDPSDFDDDDTSDSAPSAGDTTIDTSTDYSGFDVGPGDFDRDDSGSDDSGGGDMGYGGDPDEGGYGAGRAKGGLIEKQMKQSGIASKK